MPHAALPAAPCPCRRHPGQARIRLGAAPRRPQRGCPSAARRRPRPCRVPGRARPFRPPSRPGQDCVTCRPARRSGPSCRSPAFVSGQQARRRRNAGGVPALLAHGFHGASAPFPSTFPPRPQRVAFPASAARPVATSCPWRALLCPAVCFPLALGVHSFGLRRAFLRPSVCFPLACEMHSSGLWYAFLWPSVYFPPAFGAHSFGLRYAFPQPSACIPLAIGVLSFGLWCAFFRALAYLLPACEMHSSAFGVHSFGLRPGSCQAILPASSAWCSSACGGATCSQILGKVS